MNDKFVIAYRYKVNDNFKKGIVFFSSGAVLIFILTCIIASLGKGSASALSLFLTFMIAGITFCIIMAYTLYLTQKQAKISNSLPEEAIYFHHGRICLVNADITEILPSEIKEIKTRYYVEEEKRFGNKLAYSGEITIITTDNQRFTLKYIENIKTAKNRLTDIRDGKFIIISGIFFEYSSYDGELQASDVVRKGRTIFDIYIKCQRTVSIKSDDDDSVKRITEDMSEKSINTFKTLWQKLEEYEATAIRRASCDLLELANDWAGDDCDTITDDKFLQDLTNGGILNITVEKNSCTFYMSAQNYFGDHGIEYTVNMDDTDDYYVDIV